MKLPRIGPKPAYLRDLAENHQVLYFTCTKDQIVPSKEMLVLNKLEEGVNNEKCRKFKSGDSVNHFSYS